jgi:hypothetical protein
MPKEKKRKYDNSTRKGKKVLKKKTFFSRREDILLNYEGKT